MRLSFVHLFTKGTELALSLSETYLISTKSAQENTDMLLANKRISTSTILFAISLFVSNQLYAVPLYTVIDLGTLNDTSESTARGINNDAQIVGISTYNESAAIRPFIWENGQMTDLGSLENTDHDGSGAYAINDNGAVVGYSNVNVSGFGAQYHAVLWDNGTITDLGTLGGNAAYARDLNDSNKVVGSSYTLTAPNQPSHAFLWENGEMQDLTGT